MTIVDIPSKAFARGSVVARPDGPNMLVVRSWPDKTVVVVVVVEGDKDGQLRLRDVDTSDLELIAPARTPLDAETETPK